MGVGGAVGKRSFRSPASNEETLGKGCTLHSLCCIVYRALSIPCAVFLSPSVGISGCPRDTGATSSSWECKVGVCAEEVRGPREGHTAQLRLIPELKLTSLLGLSCTGIPPAIFSYLFCQLSVFKSLSNA